MGAAYNHGRLKIYQIWSASISNVVSIFHSTFIAHATKNDDETALERATEGADAFEDREFDNFEIENDEPVIEDLGDAEELGNANSS